MLLETDAVAAPETTRHPDWTSRFRHPVARNAAALYIQQAAAYLFPLITIPYLARVLRPEGWGLVVFAQAFAAWMARFLEYGFNLSATRDIAGCTANRSDERSNDAARLSGLTAGVMGAQAILAVLSAVGAVAAYTWVGAFRDAPFLLVLAWLIALGTGCMPTWFFQGIQKMGFLATISVVNRAVGTLGIVLIVHSPLDAWKVLALQAITSWIALVWAYRRMYRHVAFAMPSIAGALLRLREGWRVFLLRGSITLYTTANTFVLGILVPVATVGIYGGAERLSRSCLDALAPISQSLYPHMNALVAKDRGRAANFARSSFIWTVALALAGALSLIVCAPLIVRVFLGHGYEAAVPVLQIMALLLPLVAASNVLGVQWMVPLRMEKPMSLIILCAGVLNLSLAILLAPRWGPVGMATAVTAAEAFVTLAMFGYLRRSRIDPFSEGRTGARL